MGKIFYLSIITILIILNSRVFCEIEPRSDNFGAKSFNIVNLTWKTIRIIIDYEDFDTGYSSYFDKSFILKKCYESVDETKFILIKSTGTTVDITFQCVIGIVKPESHYYCAISYIILLNYLNGAYKSIGPSMLFNYSNIDNLQNAVIKAIRNQIYYLNQDVN